MLWLTEATWERCVDGARTLLPADAELTLLYVMPSDVEELAGGARAGLLGRRPRHRPEPDLRAVSAAEAQALLQAALQRLGLPAELTARRGQVEREVVQASGAADLLVVVRDGEASAGPKSLGPRARFVVDHALCPVVLLPGGAGWRPPAG